MSNITTGLYKTSAQAADAVRRLELSGVPVADIRIVASNLFVSKDGIFEEPHSKAPEGFAIGAAGGGTIGAVAAGVAATAAIAAGTAGIGLIAAGPIAAAIAGAGAGAAAGSVVGGMVGAAIPEGAKKSGSDVIASHSVDSDSVWLGVRTKDYVTQEAVKEMLAATGAETVD